MKSMGNRSFRNRMILLAIGAIALVLMAAFFHFSHQKQFIRLENHSYLHAISELKTNQLTQWYQERLSEAKFFSTNAPYNTYINEIIRGNKSSESGYREALLHIMSGKRYENIMLISAEGEVVYSTVAAEKHPVDSVTRRLIDQARSTREIIVSDFYFCPEHDRVHIDFISPAFDEHNALIAFLIFRVEPDDYIMPLIREWPIPSESAETYIVRQEGDSVLFLSQLRHVDMKPLQMKLSLNQERITAVQAAKGASGIMEGTDYRGVKVLADIRKVPQTSWYMISEIDHREIYRELYRHAALLTILILISVMLIGFVTAWIYHYRQRNIYRELFEKQNLLSFREDELKATLYSIGEGVITADKNGFVINLNPAAAAMTGWSEQEARLRKANEVVRIIDELNRKPLENPVDKVLREGKVVEITNHAVLLSRDGREIPVSDNAAPITDREGKILGVVLVISNQTVQRARQKALAESEEKYRCITENITDVVWTSDLELKTTYVSPSVERLLGESPEKHMLRPMTEKFPPESLQVIERVLYEEMEKEKDPEANPNRTRMFEVEHYRADGSLIWVGMNVSFTRDAEGNITGFHGVTRDISEQRLAENLLRESEERYRLILDNSAEAIIMAKPDGTVLSANKAACKMFGMKAEEVYNAGPDLLRDGNNPDLPLFYEEGKEELTGEGSVERIFTRKDGSQFHAELSAAKYRDSKGVFRYSLIIRDISEKKHAEIKAEESRQALSRLISNISGIAYRCRHTPDWPMEFISQGCVKIAGYTDQEFYANAITWGSLILDEDRERVWSEINESLQKQVPFEIEYQVRHRNGRRKWVWEKGCGIYGKYNEVIAIEGFITDVTERRETEDALKDSMKNYRELIDGMNETVWVIDFDGTLIDVNRTATLNLGYTKEELLQIGLFGIDGSLTPEAIAGLAKSMPDDELQIFETSHRSKDGTIIPVEVYSSLVTYQGRKAILSIARDITLRKQMIQDIILAKEKAEESDRLKTAFLANISHEIRTPMNGILGFLDLLRKPNLTDEKKEKFIEVVSKSGERLLETINKIIEVSKIESGQVDVFYDEVNIPEIMHYHHDFFKEQAAAKGVDLILKLDASVASLTVLSDRFKLDGIFTNLINNALKFTQAGYIEFGAIRNSSDLLFYVRDTGMGIPSDKQQAVFERFVQADLSLTRPYEGSGLGLSIVKAYVGLLGGAIRLESVPGEGSTFFIVIPIKEAVEAKTEDASRDVLETTIKKKIKLLIAEDDDISVQYLKTILDGEQTELIFCSNGKDTVRAVQEYPDIAMVLMDIKMPDMSGLEATREIRKINRTLPVIAQTAYALSNDKHEIMEAGCNDYITKPINRKELMEKIARYSL